MLCLLSLWKALLIIENIFKIAFILFLVILFFIFIYFTITALL